MGGKSEKAPTPYQPAYQGQADAGYQQLVQNNMPWATALPGQVIPGLNTAAQNVINNPYAMNAQTGANRVSALAMGGSPMPVMGYPTATPGSGSGYDPMTASRTYMQGPPSKTAGGFAGTMPAVPEAEGMYGAPYTGAPQGADAGYGGGGVAGSMLNSSQNLYGLGDMAAGMAPMAGQGYQMAAPMLSAATNAGFGGVTSGLEALTRGRQISDMAMGQAPGAFDRANTLWGETQGAIPGLTGGMDYANRMLDTGFDPQGGLYDREYQKMLDQQNAINSMYGVSGSPYGAGVAGDASRNFNLDWQNSQLGRQLAALSGYDQHTGQTTANLTNLLNTGAAGYNSMSGTGMNLLNTGSNAMNQGVDNYRQGIGTYLNGLTTGSNAYNSMMGGAVDRFGAMSHNAGDLYAQGAGQGVDALNTLNTASQLPSQTYLQQQQAAMAALAALSAGAGSAMNPTNPLIDAQGRYLGIGQNATAGAQNAVQINNAAKAAETQALMQGIGMVASVAMAPMTGGASLFGLGAGAGGGMNFAPKG